MVRRYLTRLAVFAGCFVVANVITLIVVVLNGRAGVYGVTDAIAIPIGNTLSSSFLACAWFLAMTLMASAPWRRTTDSPNRFAIFMFLLLAYLPPLAGMAIASLYWLVPNHYVISAWYGVSVLTIGVIFWADLHDLFSSRRLTPLHFSLGKGSGTDD